MRKYIAVVLSSLALVLAFAASVCAAEKANTDADFLSKVVPGVTAVANVSDYMAKNGSEAKVKEFAASVAKEHKEFVKSATENAKRLKIAVGTDQDKEGKEMIEKLTKLEGSDRDAAYLQWLIGGHEKGMPAFEAEVKNSDDADLKTMAQDAIKVGKEHIKEAKELLAKVKK
jgi:predicted outer membrane protein